MALVACGRCGKGYSDKMYPACPACGGQPDSKPERASYVAPTGRAPGEAPEDGPFWTTGHIVAAAAAVVLIGYGVVRSVASRQPAAPESAAAPIASSGIPGSGGGSSGWSDRVESGVQSMTAGADGMYLAGRIVGVLHDGANRPLLSGASVSKRGKEAVISISISWVSRQGVGCSTNVDWAVSESRGHVQAAVTSDSSPDGSSSGAARALNRYFRDEVYPSLSRAMAQPGGSVPTAAGRGRTQPPTQFMPQPQPQAQPAPQSQPQSQPQRHRRRRRY